MDKDLRELAVGAAEEAFDLLSKLLGGDNFVTTKYDNELYESALDSFKNEGLWTEDEIERAEEIIDQRIWELTTVE